MNNIVSDKTTTAQVVYIDKKFFPTFPVILLKLGKEFYIDIESASNHQGRSVNEYEFMFWYNTVCNKSYFWVDQGAIMVSWIASFFTMHTMKKKPTWEQSVEDILEKSKSNKVLWSSYDLSDVIQLIYNLHFNETLQEGIITFEKIINTNLTKATINEAKPENTLFSYGAYKNFMNYKHNKEVEYIVNNSPYLKS